MNAAPLLAAHPPPSDLHAEQAALGSTLIDPSSIGAVRRIVEPGDFYHDAHRVIFEAILALRDRDAAVDLVTVSTELQARGFLENIGGSSYLVQLTDAVPTAANAREYAQIVRQKAAERLALERAEEFSTLVRLGDFQQLVASNERYHLGALLREAAPARPAARCVCLADVTPERVSWLWGGRIPRGKLTLLDGDPGLGKSTLALDVAARLTTGRPMPGIDVAAPAGAVLLLTAEDGLGDTVRPRLEAAGADLSRVHALTLIAAESESGERVERAVSIPEDLPEVEGLIMRHSVALVILDPLMAYMSAAVHSYRDQDVRRALAPLAALAERTGAAVLVIRHLNKAGGGPAIYRGGGSIGIIGAARSGLLVGKHPDDESRRVLAVAKSNLSAPVESLEYRLEPTENGAVRVEWLGACDLRADALLAPPAAELEPGALDAAKAFLTDVLASGPVAAADVARESRDAGIKEKTLRRARESLGIRPRKEGFSDSTRWVWELPDSRRCPKPLEDAHSPEMGIFGKDGHLRYECPPVGDAPESVQAQILAGGAGDAMVEVLF